MVRDFRASSGAQGREVRHRAREIRGHPRVGVEPLGRLQSFRLALRPRLRLVAEASPWLRWHHPSIMYHACVKPVMSLWAQIYGGCVT